MFQGMEQFPSSSECTANFAKLRDGEQVTGNGEGENVCQVVDAGKVDVLLRDESGSGGLIEKFLTLVWSTADE